MCEHLSWTTPNGQYKVHSCLTLLDKLEAHGAVTLPAKRIKKAPGHPIPMFQEPPATAPLTDTLVAIAPITLHRVTSTEERAKWKAYLQTYHYLGYKHPIGAQLGYLVVSAAWPHPLGCLLFSASAAWALAPRDHWIGWDAAHRSKWLPWVLRNDRFLIFPWIDVPNLASHVLSLATHQIGDDWVQVYGYRPVLIETFVDPSRYAGTCYRAANWHRVGHTQGRKRAGATQDPSPTKKEIFLYPLQSDWRQCLTSGPRAVEVKKRYRHDLQASRTRSVGEPFVAFWHQVVHLLHEVAAQYDARWRVRKRVIDSLILMLLIFRLVSSHNSQSYGTTIDDLWDSADRLQLAFPQPHSIAASSFCAARHKLDETIFKAVNRTILEAYASEAVQATWRGHRLFAVDGSKLTLPRELLAGGYTLPSETAHYPQGVLSCLYHLHAQLPWDFDLVAHGNERLCALQHLAVLEPNDVVVYDRGYFSYHLLQQHWATGIHAIFRLQDRGVKAIREFLASSDTDTMVTIALSASRRRALRKTAPAFDGHPIPLRLLKYERAGTQFCVGTTLVDPQQRYPLQEFMDVYHARWGVEELYKVSKRLFTIEDFHAKTERGVKQELFAHFVLITMNRLF
ncbi:MAG: IS4 family transposase, partial [Candidatus Acidiferrales bacterium]